MLNSYKIFKLFSLSLKLRSKPVFFIFYFLTISPIKAQENLVPNGSFEEYNWCPLGLADFSVSQWYCATWGTCDYFNECNSSDVNVPNNYFGNQIAYEGNAYVGLGVIFDSTGISYREYIEVELNNSLKKDKFYFFSCFVSKADSSNVCLTDLGIAFSNTQIGGAFLNSINYTPQFTNSLSNVTCDEVEWNKIEFGFIAKGDERYLTIGCFENDLSLDTLILNESNQGQFAYYYFDSVTLIEVEMIIPNVFTPDGDGINDFWVISNQIPLNGEIQIFNRWGQIVAKCPNGIWNGQTDSGIECPDGVYFYKLDYTNKTGYIHLIR